MARKVFTSFRKKRYSPFSARGSTTRSKTYDAFDVVEPLAEIGLALSGLEAATGRTAPDVIT